VREKEPQYTMNGHDGESRHGGSREGNVSKMKVKEFCAQLRPNEVQVVFFYASWNDPRKRIPPSFADESIQVKAVQVDGDDGDDSMSICIGDDCDDANHDHSAQRHKLNVPDTLPVLMLFHTNSEGDIDQRQILSVNIHQEALQSEIYKLQYKYSSASRRIAPGRRNSINGDIPMALLTGGDFMAHAGETYFSTSTSADSCLRIFVAGDRSQVGKSSVCLGILGTLHERLGYEAHELAYIKPATQCEAPQLVQHYCKSRGIRAVPIGPIVYHKGFTRAFLAGETESKEALLLKAAKAVNDVCMGKRVVIIDGVGFPAVGSITGTDNASVAKACGYPSSTGTSTRSPGVVLVGPSGVGNAVDSFHLNATYFLERQVPVMGGIFNKLSTDPANYYSLESCKEQVTSYFRQFEPSRIPFGFVPVVSELGGTPSSSETHVGQDVISKFISVFAQHVNVQRIVDAASTIRDFQDTSTASSEKRLGDTTEDGGNEERPAKKLKASGLTRDVIEARARAQGASRS